ncbi:MAG: CinA family protein [Actinomycetaceae bacterium]|nr:CinA family protein [Actinomycetaceae bacterium]
MSDSLAELSAQVVHQLIDRGLTIACAESLTGGLLCATLIDTAGASNCVRGGACTYATDTKASVLHVDSHHLARKGPVDPDTATMMAEGVAELYQSDWALSTTGVAGPGPADGYEAGTVYIGWCDRLTGQSHAWKYLFAGDRSTIRKETVRHALRLVRGLLADGGIDDDARVR